jgi:hypothetical protein
MDPKEPTGGRELHKTSTPAASCIRPIFFPLAQYENQELSGDRESGRQNRPNKLFIQTFNSFQL